MEMSFGTFYLAGIDFWIQNKDGVHTFDTAEEAEAFRKKHKIKGKVVEFK